MYTCMHIARCIKLSCTLYVCELVVCTCTRNEHEAIEHVPSPPHLVALAEIGQLPRHDIDEHHHVRGVEQTRGGGVREDVKEKLGHGVGAARLCDGHWVLCGGGRVVRVGRVGRAVYGWLAASSSRTSSVDEVHHLLTEVARVGLLSERLHHQISGWVYTHTQHIHTISKSYTRGSAQLHRPYL